MTTSEAQLSLLAPDAPTHQPADDAVRLLLFNAQHASPDRSRRQAAWLADQDDADIVVLTEVSSTQGGHALVSALRDRGYATVIAPQPDVTDYRTVIACRTPDAVAVDIPVPHLPHRAPAAHISIGGHTVGIMGLYVPSRGPKERRNEAKRAFQEAVTKALPTLPTVFPEMPVIVVGDLNVIEREHQPPHRVFGAWEYAFYDSFKDANLTDAFRHLHPNQTAHSWYGRSGNGFRFDHIFITSGHTRQIVACDYHHEAREDGLTDHAVMTLQLDLTRPS